MILVTGATGKVGSEVVKQLSDAGHRVRAFVRSPEKAEAIAYPNVLFAYGDFSQPNSLDAAMKGIDKVFLVLSASRDFVELEGNVIDAAKRAGVKHIVKVSAIGVSDKSDYDLPSMHRASEKRIEDSGMAYTHLRPHFFMQNLVMSLGTIASDNAIYSSLGDTKMAFVDARDIAAVAVKALTEEGHENKAYDITGSEAITYTELASKLSSTLGKEIKFVNISHDEAQTHLAQIGFPDWLASDLVTLFKEYEQGLGPAVSDTVEKVTGRQATNYDQFLIDHKGMFDQ